jgi:hypothetical protein
MPSVVARLRRWLGWRWAVLAVGRTNDEVSIVPLPRDLPVSVRGNTDDTVSVTIGHADEGEALLAELRSVVGRDEAPERTMFRT